ncbi:MAG: DVU_1557 family redox protein [Syntrophorhabdales bacterium]|jgi:hypothetical protein
MDECQNLRIASEVELTLERRAIRAEDIRKVLVRALETGEVYMHGVTGHYLAYDRPSSTTYWVEYGLEDGSYRIYNAYSHRMEILHGFNMPAKRKEAAEWTCVKCGLVLELATVKLAYLDETFGVDIPACPSCGRAYVSESDAVGKMALAEKMLEDK